ncbi:MAG TPA: DUF1343 domain-containing protein [Acidobacteriota bacterium]|nr:DUF1343 domain-containing protein [Acidobacteriota bacterium]
MTNDKSLNPCRHHSTFELRHSYFRRPLAAIFLTIILLVHSQSHTSHAERLRGETTSKIVLGSDQLSDLKWLEGKKIGLVTNHTGLNSHLQRTADVIHQNPKLHLSALFTPEHGLMGAAQAGVEVKGESDEATGVPVFSLYSESREPTAEMLRGIDVLLFELQDLGVRFYTNTAILESAMRGAARAHLPLVVLDRPSPLTGARIAGPMLDPAHKSFVGPFPVPVQYGMTYAELAQYINAELAIRCDLRVVKLKNWRRNEWFDQTGLPWITPSPNIPTLDSAIVYPGLCWIEGTNLSEGRGTTHPFEWIGAPWLDNRRLANELNAKQLPGVFFRPIAFQPTFSKYKDGFCRGVQVHVLDRNQFDPFRSVLELIVAVRRNHPDRFQFLERGFDRLTGSDKTRKQIEAGLPVEKIMELWKADLAAFQARRAKYLIYE